MFLSVVADNKCPAKPRVGLAKLKKGTLND